MLFISGIEKFYIVALFYRFYFFSQLLDNLFLTVKTIFNWNFQSIATSTIQPFVAKYLRKECSDLNEMASDNDDVKDHVEVVEISTGETLTMLDRLVNRKYLSKDERNSLVAMKFKSEKIRVLKKKQIHISDYFMLE